MSLLGWILGGESTAPDGDAPQPGNVYAFETRPLTEFAAPITNRYAAIKFLDVSDTRIVIGVLDGIWNSEPTLEEARGCRLLRRRQQEKQWPGRLEVFGTNQAWWPTDQLKNVQFLGKLPIRRDEGELARRVMAHEPGSVFTAPAGANWAAEGEWRWANDREALVAEGEKARQKAEESRRVAEHRYRERLSKLTYEMLLAETPLARWTGSSPYPPEDFTTEARSRLHEAARALQNLGPKPRKAWVRKILKDTVQWFNEADEHAENVIETEEREDICAALEELAFVARQRSLVDEIDEWREW